MFCAFGNAMESEEKREQCYIIQYCVRGRLSVADVITEMEGVYGDRCLSKVTISRWHKAFGEG